MVIPQMLPSGNSVVMGTDGLGKGELDEKLDLLWTNSSLTENWTYS
jgi:hypothetical protein